MMRKLLLAVAVVLGFVGIVPGAGATVITVDRTDDNFGFGSPGCSLRNAVATAASDVPGYGDCPTGSGDDTVRIPTGLYKLTIPGAHEGTSSTGDLNVSGPQDLTIEPTGPNEKVTIDGNGIDRIFTHTGGASAGDLTIRNMILTGGSTTGAESPGLGIEGGAVFNVDGRLVLDGVLLFNNHSAYIGGAIYNSGSLLITNTTFSGNRADGSGGAIYNGDYSLPVNPGSVQIRSSTITDNEADSNTNGTGAGGGIVQDSEHAMNMYNSIIAGNRDASAPSIPDCRSAPNFFPRYVISTQALGAGECLTGFDPGNNLSPVDPQLEGLADNGGVTFTHALPLGSPAINAGSDGSLALDACPATDQRGFARTFGRCDMGAYEYQDVPPEPLPGIPGPTASTATFDGVNLFIRLKCPARFRPRCNSTVVPVTARRNGQPMAAAVRVSTRSNGSRRISFRIRPAFRDRVAAMTFEDRRRLVVKQKIRSRRVRSRRATRPSTVFHKYKVRVRV